ncbi:unnamed protein product, partial [Meganyctiphanes norvegica]
RLLSGQCPESRCELVYNKSLIHSTDALIFSSMNMCSKKNFRIPDYRRQDQPWIFLSLEPDYSIDFKYLEDKLFRFKFNWTMHYRQDSDIVVPYGSVTPKSADD